MKWSERWLLGGGADGGVPSDDNYRLALLDIASLEDVSIVAAPGAAAYAGIAQAVNARLIAHASARRAYRIAVLDTPPRPDARRGARGAAARSIRRTPRSTTRG